MSIQEKVGFLRYSPEDILVNFPDELSCSPALPDEPLLKIRPRRAWYLVDLGEFWAHRELLYFLIWRDLKVRYKQMALGSLWVILQPLLMTVIFTVFLGKLVRVPLNDVPYSAFAYAGLLSWTFLCNAILSSSHSLVGNVHLITKVYFPRLFVPLAAVAVRLFDFIIAAIIMVGLLLYHGFTPTWGLILFPVLVLEMMLFALGFGLLSAALNVRYRDIGTLLPVLLQLWMFVSPVIYPSSIVPPRWHAIYMLNPLAGILESQRAALFGLKFDWTSLFVSALVTVLLLLFSVLFFQQTEESLADVI